MGLLTGKTALVTGAARGIGKAVAMKFASEGANIAFTDLVLNDDMAAGLEATRKEIEALGVTCRAYAGNAADFEETEKTVKQIHADFGSIDILVNNAGVLDGQLPIHETTPEVYDMIYETNQRAVFLCCQRAIRIFLEQGTPANIVNVASAASLRGLKGGAMYVTTKHAVLGLTRNISASFFERGIRCNCIEPANILTEINKVPREKGIGILEWQMRAGKAAPLHTITKPGEKKPMLGKPKDCANAIAYLADDVAARYISGAELKVDAGWLNM